MRTVCFKLTQDMIDEFQQFMTEDGMSLKKGHHIRFKDEAFYIGKGKFYDLFLTEGDDWLDYDRMFYEYLKKEHPEVLI